MQFNRDSNVSVVLRTIYDATKHNNSITISYNDLYSQCSIMSLDLKGGGEVGFIEETRLLGMRFIYAHLLIKKSDYLKRFYFLVTKMTSKKNLWGQLPSPETQRTPCTILKEQASMLTEITNGLLVGEVKRSSEVDAFSEFTLGKQSQSFVAYLRIQVPSLNNYTYSVVRIQYPIRLYTCIGEELGC